MTISTIGSHTVSSCPYCDKLMTVSGTDAEGLRLILALLQEHLGQSAECKIAHQKTVRHVFGTLTSNPLTAAFLDEVFPHERLHDDALLNVAKITRDGQSEPYYLEAADLAALPTTLGTDARFTIQWERMTVKEYEALSLINKAPASPNADVQMVAQGDEC